MSAEDTGDRPLGNKRTEIVPDRLRQLLVVLVTKAWAEIRSDPEMIAARGELEDLMRLMSGSDVQLRSVRPGRGQVSDRSAPELEPAPCVQGADPCPYCNAPLGQPCRWP